MITMPAVPRLPSASDRLRRVLATNATASALGGLVATTVPGRLDDLLDTGHPGWVRAVGLGLVAFAVAVAGVARTPVAARRWARWVSEADAAWVIASMTTIAAGWYSAAGSMVVAAVAAAVAVFGVLQWRWSGSAA